jgi:hypothetical protein
MRLQGVYSSNKIIYHIRFRFLNAFVQLIGVVVMFFSQGLYDVNHSRPRLNSPFWMYLHCNSTIQVISVYERGLKQVYSFFFGSIFRQN